MKSVSLNFASHFRTFEYQNIQYNIVSCEDKFVFARKIKGRKELRLPLDTMVLVEDIDANMLERRLLRYNEEIKIISSKINEELKIINSQK